MIDPRAALGTLNHERESISINRFSLTSCRTMTLLEREFVNVLRMRQRSKWVEMLRAQGRTSSNSSTRNKKTPELQQRNH